MNLHKIMLTKKAQIGCPSIKVDQIELIDACQGLVHLSSDTFIPILLDSADSSLASREDVNRRSCRGAT